ncbi:MAG TPA: hypothetical protein VK738_19960 [Terriglobales bacterium]|jgi:hypothetical protein|nr:hypothetical protein [Terriglobales bacterium]
MDSHQRRAEERIVERVAEQIVEKLNPLFDKASKPHTSAKAIALVKRFLTSALVALFCSLLLGSLTLYGVINLEGARVLLIITYLIGVGGVALVVWEKSRMFKIVSIVVATIGFGIGSWLLDAWAIKTKDRHLNAIQKQGLAQMADKVPSKCGVLIYVPETSKEAQRYGKEVQAAWQSHGAKANLIYGAAVEPPVGLVVGVHSQLEPCGRFGGEVLSTMTFGLGLPARIQDGFFYADETTIVIYVGTKPPYD